MSIESIIILLCVGAFAGWLTGMLSKGKSYGLIINTLVGCTGAIIGSWIFSKFGVPVHGILKTLLAAISGSFVLLLIVSILR